jgi:alpha-1,6-mannosyltransferase
MATLLHGALFAGAVWLVWAGRARGGWLIFIVLAIAASLRVIAFATPHDGLTTDAYRYVWDGRIQWAGFNPYSWVPAAPELSELRDTETYPNINQKERAVTIYPPFAQILFAAGNLISDTVTGPKIVMALADLGIIAVLLLLLRVMGQPSARVILYAWHPLPLWEFTSQAHIDAAAAALMMLTILAVMRGRQGVGGVLLAAATLTKLFPLALAPALWRRWDWRMPLAFAATCIALALPYYLWGRPDLSGYLGTHLDMQGYAAGWGFHPVWMLRDFEIGDMSGRTYVALSLCLLAGLGLWALFARGRDAVRPDQMAIIAAAFIWLTSPHYPWYVAWLVPLLCLWVSPSLLAMTLFAPVLYFPRPPGGVSWSEIYAVVFWLPLLMAAVELAVRWRNAQRLRTLPD